MNIPSAFRQMNSTLGIARSLCPMVAVDNANVTWPDNIHFLTVDTTITKDGCQVQFTQPFTLPQGQQSVTRANISLHVTCGYIGVDPSTLLPAMFKAIIIEPTGIALVAERE